MSVAPTLIDLANEGVGSAPGTGTTIVLSGTANSGGYLTWSSAGAVNGLTYRFNIVDGSNREEATGVYNSSSNEFTNRTTLIASVAGVKQTTAINATSSAVISAVALAEDILTPGTLQYWLPGGCVNAFRNMGCDVDQRKTSSSAATVTTSGAYVTDGDIVLPTGASVTAGQVASQSGMQSANSLQVTGASSCTGITVRRRIESIEVSRAGLVGQTVIVQCKIYNNTGASITPQLSIGHPTSTDTYSSVGASSLTNELSATNLQACANGAVTTVAYVLTLSSSAANGLEINLNLGNNFSTTGKTAQVTDWDIRAATTIPALGLISNPPPPELRPYFIEFLNCQRYLPGVSGSGPWGNTITGEYAGTCCVGNLRVYLVSFQFPVPTRVAVTGATVGNGSTQSVSFKTGGISGAVLSDTTVTVPNSSGWLVLQGSSSSSYLIFTGAEL